MGLASITAVVLVLIVTDCAHVRSGGGSAAGTVSSMIIWAGVFVMVGVAEEFASRGCALRSLTEGIGFFSGGAANLALVRLPASP